MIEFFPQHYRWSYTTLLAFAAGGQLGDIALILPRLQSKVGDDDLWFNQWTWLANVLEKRAEGGSDETASENLFLASLYHTIGEHFVSPADPRRLESYHEVLRTFEAARAKASFLVERVEIPFEGSSLPAYFMPATGAGPKPTLIFICGLDTTKELWFLRARQQFTQRGFNCLFVDTPGIGEALRLRKFYTRFDYEVPVAAAVDYLVTRPDVDAERVGIIGSSLGGYYISRAAAYEGRIKAAVAWGAIYDYGAIWRQRLAGKGSSAAPTFQLMFITGTDTIEEAVRHVENFSIRMYADKLECPFLIVHGSDDRQIPESDATAMFNAIASKDKELKIFSGEDGGSAHTQFDNHLPAIHYVADWVRKKL